MMSDPVAETAGTQLVGDRNSWLVRASLGRKNNPVLAPRPQAVATVTWNSGGEWRHPPLPSGGLRLDVLVQMEEVVRVVLSLDLDQPLVVLAEVRRCTTLVVVRREVDVAALL